MISRVCIVHPSYLCLWPPLRPPVRWAWRRPCTDRPGPYRLGRSRVSLACTARPFTSPVALNTVLFPADI